MGLLDIDEGSKILDDIADCVAVRNWLISIADPKYQNRCELRSKTIPYRPEEMNWLKKNGKYNMPFEMYYFVTYKIPQFDEFYMHMKGEKFSDSVILVAKDSIKLKDIKYDINGLQVLNENDIRGSATPMYKELNCTYSEYYKISGE